MLRAVFITLLLATLAARAVAQPATSRQPRQAQAGSEQAQRPLMVGDPAPPLTIDRWLKGEPVSRLEKGRVYVIEFWSPSSAGSAANMPYLTEIQNRYQDTVTVIGVTGKDPRHDLAAAQAALTEHAGVIDYSIAWDLDRRTFSAYMGASGSKFLPTAFIIDRDGMIAHIDAGAARHLDRPLREIVEGSYSLVQAAREYRERVDRPEQRSGRGSRRSTTFPGADVERFKRLLESGETRKAYEFGHHLVDGPLSGDSMSLNELAWAIVGPENKVEEKDLDLAMKATTRSNELTRYRSAAYMDTLARAYFCKGDTAKAIEFQRKAVAALAQRDVEIRAGVIQALAEYEEAAAKGK